MVYPGLHVPALDHTELSTHTATAPCLHPGAALSFPGLFFPGLVFSRLSPPGSRRPAAFHHD